MKKVISLVTIAFSFNVFATSVRPMPPPQGVTPNMFECKARNDTTVSYTSSSFIGTPTMHVRFQGDEAQLNGDIQSEQTPVGRMVFADDRHMTLVDGPAVRYALILPKVVLKDNASVETFETVLVRSNIGGGMHRPTFGVFGHSEAVNVECTAQFVWF